MDITFVRTDCVIVHHGRRFESGGAYIVRDRSGRHGGLLYAYPLEGKVGDWHGRTKVLAYYGREWRSNMGDVRQSVSFTWKGIRFCGVYYKSLSDIVRVREIRSR